MESIATEKLNANRLIQHRVNNYLKKFRRAITTMDKETRNFNKFAQDFELNLVEIDIEFSDIEEWIENYSELRKQMIAHLKNTAALADTDRL